MRLPIAAAVLLLCGLVLAAVMSFSGHTQHASAAQSSLSLLQQRASLRTARIQQLASKIPGLVRCSGFVSCPLGFKIPKNFRLTGQFGGDALTIVDNPDDSFLNVRGMNPSDNDVGYATAPVANIIRLASKHEVQANSFDSHIQSQIQGTDRPRVQLAAAASPAASNAAPDDVVSQFNDFAGSVLDSEQAAAAAQKELNEEGWEDEPVPRAGRGAHAAHSELQAQAADTGMEQGYLERQRRLFTRGLSQSMTRMLRRKRLPR
jgi:hypothetical protein